MQPRSYLTGCGWSSCASAAGGPFPSDRFRPEVSRGRDGIVVHLTELREVNPEPGYYLGLVYVGERPLFLNPRGGHGGAPRSRKSAAACRRSAVLKPSLNRL
jgi:hypothetical protein